jgi:hypothetical protein
MTQKYHEHLSNRMANLGYAPSLEVQGFPLLGNYLPGWERLLPKGD